MVIDVWSELNIFIILVFINHLSFIPTISHKIFETNSSFHVKLRTTAKL